MTSEEAVRLVKSQDSWNAFLQSFGVEATEVKLQIYEYPRCWIATALVGDRGIPPGLGFVVDKVSRNVFVRRLADVLSVIEE
jgi:hypothetical protein